jgi:hypothetical protein
MKKSLLILCLSGLYSCSSLQTGDRDNQPGFYPPVASKIILHQPLKVLADRAGLYLQNGENKGGAHSRFEPFCYIRFFNVKQMPRAIQADTFIVKSIRTETRLVAYNRPLSAPFQHIAYRLVDSTPSDILEVVTMRISSLNQPEVYLLECGGVENDPASVEPPTINEIRRAMGNLMTLQMP